MKIKKVPTETPFTFQPITIQFTIETEEELNVLKIMYRFNVYIPEFVSDDKDKQQIIHDFLGMFQDTLID
jgi:hypothetical protein